MTKKLLIVGGDSWSHPKEDCYIEHGINKIWPDVVAEYLDVDLINISKGGVGNDWIHNKVIDAIEENSNRDIIVMANWSQACRIAPFELESAQLQFSNYMSTRPKYKFGAAKFDVQEEMRKLYRLAISDHPKAIPKEEFWLSVANVSLRHIYLLDQYCKHRNIQILHHRALSILRGIEWITEPNISIDERIKARKEILELCRNKNQYFKKISEFTNIVGNSDLFALGSSCFELYHNYYISDEEQHPNENGHQLIAHSFINKYLELYGEASSSEPLYIYD